MKRTATLAYAGMVGLLLVGTGCVAGQVTDGTSASPTTSTPTVTRTATIISAVTPTVPQSADLTATAQASVVTSTVTETTSSPPTFTTDGEDQDDGHTAFNEVDEVTDGDTIRVFIDDFSTPVRILGINTPETVKPGTPVECYGPEASAKMHDLVDGTAVILTADPTQGDEDRYHRLLRYVTTGDTGEDVSAFMLRWGYARYVEYDGPLERSAIYTAAQDEAKANNRGGWAECGW